MAKKKTNNKNKNKNNEVVNTSYKEQIFSMIKILIIVLIVFGIFYLLTVYITNKDKNKSNNSNTNKASDSVEIQYKQILGGSSFDIDEEEYLVLFYDMSDTELSTNITKLISNYENKTDKISLYTVDMSSSFNKKFAGEKVNYNPSSVDDLSINGPTIMKFVDKKVDIYIEGYDNIEEYLD